MTHWSRKFHYNFFEHFLSKLIDSQKHGVVTTFYYYSVNHQSGLGKHIFKIIIYFFNTLKCAANYVILFEVYDGFIGQKSLKQ